jgi:hypothetical protein
VADYVPRILNEIIRFRQVQAAITRSFTNLRHNDDLCPAVERQINAFLDCSLKYRRIAYDVQGPRDRGTDVVLRYEAQEETKYIVVQVKSYHDLCETNYLQTLKSQTFEVQSEYGTQLEHLYFLLCTDVARHRGQIRNIKKDMSRTTDSTVVDPTYAWTFLKLSAAQIDGVVESILKEDDAVYRAARRLVTDLSPLETVILACLVWLTRQETTNIELNSLRSMSIVEDALMAIPESLDADYDYYWENEEEEEEDEEDEEDGDSEDYDEWPGNNEIDHPKNGEVRMADALDHLEGMAISLDRLGGSIEVNLNYCEPIEALMLDAKVRWGYESNDLVRFLINALGIPRRYEFDL